MRLLPFALPFSTHTTHFFLCPQIKTVLQWVDKLISRRGSNKVLTTDIGIVTPYIKQVQRIRKLVKVKYSGIKVRGCEGRGGGKSG
jgi:hypothetical protein